MERSKQERILEWFHGIIISDGDGGLRTPTAADVAEHWGLTLVQAETILRSDPAKGLTPAQQAQRDRDAAMMLRKGLMPAASAAKFLGISERTVRRYVAEGCPSWREPGPHGGRGVLLVSFRMVHHWRDHDPFRYLETPDVEDARPIPYDSPPRARRRRR